MGGVYVEEIGCGPRLLLVHGSGDRAATWRDQRVLADRFRLVMPDRRGYGNRAGEDPSFDRDAVDIAELLEDRTHVVGLSYGGIGCLLAAAKRQELVASLTLIEPPAFGIALSNKLVAEIVQRLEALWDAASRLTEEEFDARFRTALTGHQPSETIPTLDDDTRSAATSRTKAITTRADVLNRCGEAGGHPVRSVPSSSGTNMDLTV